jgi:hypothetical protein
MGFVIECTPAGQRRLDIPWLLGKLHDFGRDPNAILELWTPPVGTLPETIAREDAWAIESIQYSRRVIPDRRARRSSIRLARASWLSTVAN